MSKYTCLTLVATYEDHEVELVSDGDLEDYCAEFNDKNPDCTELTPFMFAISLPECDADMEELFEKCKITHDNYGLWVNDVDRLDELERAALFWLLAGCNYSSTVSAIGNVRDVDIVRGDGRRQAEEMFHDMYQIPDGARAYINYEQYAEDLARDGVFDEINFNGEDYTITNADSL